MMTITTATGVVPKLGRLTKIANEFNGDQGDIIAAGVPEFIRKNVIAVYRFSDRNKLAASLSTSTTFWSSELRENRHERLWRERSLAAARRFDRSAAYRMAFGY
jgi:hypothetical protein